MNCKECDYCPRHLSFTPAPFPSVTPTLETTVHSRTMSSIVKQASYPQSEDHRESGRIVVTQLLVGLHTS